MKKIKVITITVARIMIGMIDFWLEQKEVKINESI